MMPPFRRAIGYLLPLAGALLVAGCTAGPNFTPPAAPATRHYTKGGDDITAGAQHVVPGQRVAVEWWRAFHSPRLDRVVTMALAGNDGLAAARATLAQARAETQAATGALWPHISLGATAGRQKYGKSLFGPSDVVIPPFTYYTAGPQVSYLLDLAGGARRAVEERGALARMRSFEADALRLSVTGDVVARAFAIASARAELAVIHRIVAADRKTVSLVVEARAAGSATVTDLLSAESQLARDQTLEPPLQQQLGEATRALSILTGRAPADWQPPAFTFADFRLPAALPLSLPSELVRGRPDIMAAQARLHAASAAIGVAAARLYPSLTLSADTTQQALMVGHLFNPAANAWALAAGLTAPIFEGGRLRAEKRAAVAGYQAALADYRQTVLRSFGQVADVLRALVHDDQEMRAQRHALDTAAAALRVARISYRAGDTGILSVLDAERQYNQADLATTRVRARRFQDTALLYLALGGGLLPARG